MNRIIEEVKKCRRCDGIKMSKRIHDIDEDFFENWNSKMTYVIGFAFADGNIYQRSLAWELNLEDKDILVKINRVMKSGYPLRESKKYVKLRINSNKIVADLKRLGVVPNKSKKSKFPEVPEEHYRDFVRGFLDGDGWISTEDAKNQKRKEFSVGFSNGNREFMKNLVGNLHERLNLTINNLRKKTKITKNGRKSITYQTEWYATNAYKIIKFLYDNLKEGELYLERKYESQLKARRIYERTRKPILWRKIEDEYGMPMKSLLHEMLIEGDSNGVQIAKKLGVHSSTVYRWLAETKVRLPKKKQRKVTIKKCPICNNWFKRGGRYPKKYCSDRCRTLARRTGKTVQCAVCSKEIYRPRWWFKIDTTPICSQECMRKWQRIRVENNIISRSRKTGQFLPSKRTIS